MALAGTSGPWHSTITSRPPRAGVLPIGSRTPGTSGAPSNRQRQRAHAHHQHSIGRPAEPLVEPVLRGLKKGDCPLLSH